MSWAIVGARIVAGTDQVVECGGLRIEGENIVELGEAVCPAPSDDVFDAAGRVVMPAFVDAHTHAIWAGDRLEEFEHRLHGKSYLEIMSRGGGILATVRAVREATEAQLAENLRQRLDWMLREGTTCVEVKSGYGLSTEHELKLLRAIHRAREDFDGHVVPTALLGHAIDTSVANFVEQTIVETLPAVNREFGPIAIDAYCETGAWSVDDCRRLFTRARELGHPLRLHADQFNSIGGVQLAIELGALSVDHLEASSPQLLQRLATSPTYGVMLPASGFSTDDRYANGRLFCDSGGNLVIASNCNPGSSPTSSMPFVVALAVRKLGLSVHEAIRACTERAAALLSLTDRGVLEVGKRADVIVLRHRDERALAYEVGGNPVDAVFVGGRRVATA